MNLIKKYFLLLAILGLNQHRLFAALNVVTTTEDLAAITREIGKNLVTVDAIGKGYMDPHFIDAKPSFLLKLKRADLFAQVGLELEVGWAPSLLTSARNKKILPGNPGFFDASTYCGILQKTDGPIDRSMGDVHPFGNPHYWLDPQNGLAIAKGLAEKLSELDPDNATAYQTNLTQFKTMLEAKDKEWLSIMAPFKGTRVVTYHNSWPNFAEHFGIHVVNFIEPRPGIPPTPKHIQELIRQMKSEKITVLLIEPYFDTKLPQKIANDTGATLLIFDPSVGAEPSIKTYFDLFDHDIALLRDALMKGRNK
jgi:zinc/manganese transport system substrate-binding protein